MFHVITIYGCLVLHLKQNLRELRLTPRMSSPPFQVMDSQTLTLMTPTLMTLKTRSSEICRPILNIFCFGLPKHMFLIVLCKVTVPCFNSDFISPHRLTRSSFAALEQKLGRDDRPQQGIVVRRSADESPQRCLLADPPSQQTESLADGIPTFSPNSEKEARKCSKWA